MIRARIAMYVNAYIDRMGMNQADLAKSARCDPSAISKLLSTTGVGLDVFIKVMRATGLDVHRVLWTPHPDEGRSGKSPKASGA